MKVSVFWVMFTVFAFMSFALSTEDTISFSPGLDSQRQVALEKMILKTRRLKGIGTFTNPKMNEAGNAADLDDYRPIDPSPSSKASIRPGPIQHGTPYMPYVPKLSSPPPPPGHPKQGLLP